MTHHLLPALQPITSRVRTDATAVKIPGQGSRWTDERLTNERLARHITAGPGRGCCPIKAGESTTRLALLDLDSHDGAADWAAMARAADTLTAALIEHGLRPTPWRSSGGRGIHLIMIWDEPQDAYSAREHLRAAIATVGFKNGAKGHGVLGGEVEIFPKQDSVPADGYGNQFILPLHGQSTPLDPDTFAPLPQDAALTLAWPVSDPVPQLTKPERVSSHGTSTALPELREALAAIPQETDPPDYDTWRNIVFAIHHETNGDDDGLALVHEFSARSSKYDPDLIDNRIWPYIRSDRDQVITGATITHLARTYGWNSTTADDFDDPGSDEADDPATSTNPYTPVKASLFTKTKPLAYLIKGILPEADDHPTLAMMYGGSGDGKSFMATDMACAIAMGAEWRGRRVKKGRVVYVCAEGAGGYRKRLVAYCQHHGIDIEDLDVWVVHVAPDLLKKDKVKQLIKALEPLSPIALVVVDTLARSTPGADENSAKEMGEAVAACTQISLALHATVLIIHHSGKDDTKGARGSSAIRAAVDTELAVTREPNKNVRGLTVTKQKDGEDGEEMGFSLEIVTIGLDDEGDPITSCVVEHSSVAPKKSKTKTPSKHQKSVIEEIEALTDLTEEGADQETVIANVAKRQEVRASVVRRTVKEMLKSGALLEENGRLQVA